MRDEYQPPAAKPKKFKGLLITGLLLMAAGSEFIGEGWRSAAERSWLGRKFDLLIIVSPAMVVLGFVMLLVALFRSFRRSARSAPAIPPRAITRLERAWRFFIWAVACLTVFPWLWMDTIVWLNGGRPGNEGEGMGGALICMFFGLPSLALAIFNEIRLKKNRIQKK